MDVRRIRKEGRHNQQAPSRTRYHCEHTRVLRLRYMKKSRRTSNRRVMLGGTHWLALVGYFASPVQRVVRRWSREVHREQIEQYFAEIGKVVVFQCRDLQLTVRAPSHWECVWDLASAINTVMSRRGHTDYWLLKMSNTATNDEWPKWSKVAWQIEAAGGPRFTTAALAQASKRLRLSSPPELVREYLRWRQG